MNPSLGVLKRDFFMEKIKNIKSKGAVLGILAVILILPVIILSQQQPKTQQSILSAKTAIQHSQITNLNYKGQDGNDALTLLKQNAVVEQDKSGLVTVINNRKAENASHEFWAFYVNGKQASVGPADYITKNEDLIQWKIEKF